MIFTVFFSDNSYTSSNLKGLLLAAVNKTMGMETKPKLMSLPHSCWHRSQIPGFLDEISQAVGL